MEIEFQPMNTSILVFPVEIWSTISSSFSVIELFNLLKVGSPLLSHKLRSGATHFDFRRIPGYLDFDVIFRASRAFSNLRHFALTPILGSQLVMAPILWEMAPSTLSTLDMAFIGCLNAFFGAASPLNELAHLNLTSLKLRDYSASEVPDSMISISNLPPNLKTLYLSGWRHYDISELETLPRTLETCHLQLNADGQAPGPNLPPFLKTMVLELERCTFDPRVLPKSITYLCIHILMGKPVQPVIARHEWKSFFPNLKHLTCDTDDFESDTLAALDVLPATIEEFGQFIDFEGPTEASLHDIASRRGPVLKSLHTTEIPQEYVKYFTALEELTVEVYHDGFPRLKTLSTRKFTTSQLPPTLTRLDAGTMILGLKMLNQTIEGVSKEAVALPSSITHFALQQTHLNHRHIPLLPPHLTYLSLTVSDEELLQELHRFSALSTLRLRLSTTNGIKHLPTSLKELSIMKWEAPALSDQQNMKWDSTLVQNLKEYFPFAEKLTNLTIRDSKGLPVQLLAHLPPKLAILDLSDLEPVVLRRNDLIMLPRSLIALTVDKWIYQWEEKEELLPFDPTFYSSAEFPLPPYLAKLSMPSIISQPDLDHLVSCMPKQISLIQNASADIVDAYHRSRSYITLS